ncbi:hypothetical protein [Elizabethkingia anophelis]|uniref:hypothetical protein n=1 Tax=Elizabethkingia anophelis TaxID=1117645 RepID=UPI00136D8014|nr:hypothetical protein [Elizabethkingia anophelis]MYY27374.1 hypothetical protein [Elizabethkingia anophelis]
MIESTIRANSKNYVSKALDYVHANSILSATDFKAYLVYIHLQSEKQEPKVEIIKLNPFSGISNVQLDIEPQKSDLDDYQELFENN